MADGNIVSSNVPEEYTRIRGEVYEAQGGVSIVRASGEEVIAEKGTKIYLNDVLISPDNAAVLLEIGNRGYLSLGQEQTLPFTQTFFERLESLDQAESETLDEIISAEALEQAIAEGKSLEEILQAPAAGEASGDDSDSGSASVTFYQRVGDSLIPVSGFETSTFSNAIEARTNEFGDANQDLNADRNGSNDDDPVNAPPVASNDGPVVVVEDNAITLSVNDIVLSNDSDADADDLRIVNVGSPSNGTVELNADGSVTFTPDENFFGEATFEYTIDDGNGGTDTAEVTLDIGAVDDPTQTAADTNSTLEDAILEVNAANGLLSNDADVDDALSVVSFSIEGNTYTAGKVADITGVGTLQLNADGSYTFDPSPNYSGDVPVVTYTTNTNASDTLTLNITPQGDPTITEPDTNTTAEDAPLVVDAANGLLANDSDVDDNLLVNGFMIDGDPTVYSAGDSVDITGVGILQLNADGSYTFDPASNFVGDLPAVIYTTNTGAQERLDIEVTPVNDAPVANDDGPITATEDTPITLGMADLVLPNDTDADGDALIISAVGNPTNGTVLLNADGTVTFTPAPDFSGTATFEYTVDDNNGGTDTATVTITVNPVSDGAPDAVDDSVTTDEDTALTNINVLGNDTLTDEATITAFDSASTNGGTMAQNADGTFNYTPAANFNGTDTFTYTLTDADGETDTATVTITVNPVNDPPEITTTDGDVSSSEVTEAVEFEGDDYVVPPGGDPSAANGVGDHLDIDQTSNVTVTFESSAAGSDINNTFGFYEIAADGTISNTSIIWDNSTGGVGPGQRTQGDNETFTVSAGSQIGFFLLLGGFNINSAVLSALGAPGSTGFVQFEHTADGVTVDDTRGPVTANDPAPGPGEFAPILVYYPDSNPGTVGIPLLGQDLLSQGFPQHAVHSTLQNLNADGLLHVTSGIDAGNNNALTLSFEDLIAPNPVDWDLVDLVVTVEIDNVVMNVTNIDPDLDIIDADSTELSSATVRIVTGREGDELILDDSLLAGTGITSVYDPIMNTLVLTGDADISVYENILQAIQLGNPGELGSDPREIEYSATDAEGATSELVTVNLNADASYDFSGDDFVAGGAGDDILDGRDGSDIIFGGQGSDNLTGGNTDTAADTFVWSSNDGDGSTDTVTDFNLANGDVLDFSDLLQGEESGTLTDYLAISSDGTDSTITVNADGVGSDTDLTVVVEGVDLTALGVDQAAILQQLIDDGNLNVNQ